MTASPKLHPSPSAGSVILAEVMKDIAQSLATRAPERGGLLFGPRGQKLVTLFVPDDDAEHHAMTYTPSAAICERSPEIETASGLEYKGIIHSHPGGFDRPSEPDLDNARRALELNPHLPHFMMPIVTLGDYKPQALEPHEVALPGGKLSHYLVTRARPDAKIAAERDNLGQLTLSDDLRRLATTLPGKPAVGCHQIIHVEGATAVAYPLELEDGAWIFAAAAGYPFTPPLAIPPSGNAAPALAWDLQIPAGDRLKSAFHRSREVGGGHATRAAGAEAHPPALPPIDGATDRPKGAKRRLPGPGIAGFLHWGMVGLLLGMGYLIGLRSADREAVRLEIVAPPAHVIEKPAAWVPTVSAASPIGPAVEPATATAEPSRSFARQSPLTEYLAEHPVPEVSPLWFQPDGPPLVWPDFHLP